MTGQRINWLGWILLTILAFLLFNFSSYSQTPAEKKKRLQEYLELVQQKLKSAEDESALFDLEVGGGLQEVLREIQTQGFEGYFFTIANRFSDQIQGKPTAGFEKISAEEAKNRIAMADKESGFYGHPINYFEHHLNWVDHPEYDSKVNFAQLEKDFNTWRVYEAELRKLFPEYGGARIEQLREWSQDREPSPELAGRVEALKQRILDLGSFRGNYGFELKPEPIPQIYLYAVTSNGLQYIEEIYFGVVTIVEATFENPYEAEKYEIELSSAGGTIKLIAKRLDPKGYIFRTEPFIPTAAKRVVEETE